MAFLLVVTAATGCGTKPHSGTSSQLSARSEFFGLLPVPASVNPDLWNQIVGRFDAELMQYGGPRTAAQAPRGDASAVGDLAIQPVSALMARATWSYRNAGDLNLDGQVTIADLTPIGVHFQQSSQDPNWLQHQVADADLNGVVSIQDLTPIGLNFRGRVTEYELQALEFGATEWHSVGSIAFTDSQGAVGPYPTFSIDFAVAGADTSYRVLPSAGAVEDPFGPPSNEVVIGEATRSWWSHCRGGTLRLGQSMRTSPESAQIVWTVDLPGSAPLEWSPVADRYGTSYFCCSPPSVSTDKSGLLSAVDRFGRIKWQYRSARPLQSQPSLAIDGTVVIQEEGGTTLAFTPDGRMKWVQPLSPSQFYPAWNPVIDPNGQVYVIDGLDKLYALSTFGEILWSQDLPDACLNLPCLWQESLFIPASYDFVYLYSTAGDVGVGVNSGAPQGLLLDPDNYLLCTNLATNTLVGWELLGIGTFTYTPSDGELGLPPSQLYGSGFVLPVQVRNNPDHLTGIVVGMNDNGMQEWERPLPAMPISSVVVGPTDDLLISAAASVFANENGVYCIAADHSIRWFVPTPQMLPGAICPAYDDLLVLELLPADSSTCQLVGIASQVPTPEQ
jgi:hypothetical protein